MNHYSDTQQAYRDNKYAWKKPDGDLYVGTTPPEGSEPLGMLYPRGGALGGSSNINAMNFVFPPDNDWNHIANLTGDSSWSADNMRRLFQRIEHNDYITEESSESREGHGFDGWLHVSAILDDQVGGSCANGTSPTGTISVYFKVSRDW